MEHLLAAKTRQEVWDASQSAFADLGFEDVYYGLKKREEQQFGIYLSDTLSNWQRDYRAEGDSQFDPLFNYTSVMPDQFFTGIEFSGDYPFLSTRDLAVIQRGADHNLYAGVAMIMPLRGADQVGGWHLMYRGDRAAFSDLYCHQSKWLAQIAAFAHQSFSRLEQGGVPLHVKLTKREAETLCWLAAGLRTDQIADKMGIKPVTVDLHIRKARERLGARTREQATAIALTSGLISI
ncbi:MAG: helix-turn-helix transcriptional regulator [Pseudomonadota bacterium]